MKKTKLSTAFVAALTAVTLCGCANVDGENPVSRMDKVSQQTSELISELTDGSSNAFLVGNGISAPVDEKRAFPVKCGIYSQKPKTFTEEQLRVLFDGVPENRGETAGGEITFAFDGQTGRYGKGNLIFYTNHSLLYRTAYDVLAESENEEERPKEEELDFASWDEVIEKVKIKMSEFGFAPDAWEIDKVYAVRKEDVDAHKEWRCGEIGKEVEENPYSLDETDLQKETEEAERIKKIPSVDFYYIDIKLLLDGIPLYMDGHIQYGGKEMYSLSGATANMLYTPNGFESVFLSGITETDTSNSGEAEIIAPDKARELLNKKFSEIILEGEVAAYDMRLIYLPIPQNDLGDYHNKFETRPFYVFYYTQTEDYFGETITNNAVTYFDAVTGEEFATQKFLGDMMAYY